MVELCQFIFFQPAAGPPVSGHPAYGCAYLLGVSLRMPIWPPLFETRPCVCFKALRDAANVAGFLSSLFVGAVVHPKRIPPPKKKKGNKTQTPT